VGPSFFINKSKVVVIVCIVVGKALRVSQGASSYQSFEIYFGGILLLIFFMNPDSKKGNCFGCTIIEKMV
jgi:hypothetical protein